MDLDAARGLLAVRVDDDDDSDLYTGEIIRRFHESQAQVVTGGRDVSMDEVLADFGLKPEDYPLKK